MRTDSSELALVLALTGITTGKTYSQSTAAVFNLPVRNQWDKEW